MDSKSAEEKFAIVLRWADSVHYLDDARSVGPETWAKMSEKEFLKKYCWVVYNSGFKNAVVTQKFPALRKAFLEFVPERLAALDCLTEALKVIRHKGKAEGFLKGAKVIHGEGWANFKQRVNADWKAALIALPRLGPVTIKHLAKDIGVADVVKDDTWLRQWVELLGAKDADELAIFLANKFGERVGVVDLALWGFCREAAWKNYGANSLERFIRA